MRSIENRIYTLLRQHLKELYPGIKVTGISEARPSVFPTVCIEVSQMTTDRSWITSNTGDTPDVITVSITVMTTDGKESAKEILFNAEIPLLPRRFTRRGYNAPRTDSGGITRTAMSLTAGYDGETFYTV